VEGYLTFALDLVLAALVLAVAWRALASADLLKAIMLFICFSLLLAIVWLRLAAPDIALAEIAIGAGLTGALLFATRARMEGRTRERE